MTTLAHCLFALLAALPVLFGLWCLVTYKEPEALDCDWEDGEPK